MARINSLRAFARCRLIHLYLLVGNYSSPKIGIFKITADYCRISKVTVNEPCADEFAVMELSLMKIASRNHRIRKITCRKYYVLCADVFKIVVLVVCSCLILINDESLQFKFLVTHIFDLNPSENLIKDVVYITINLSCL